MPCKQTEQLEARLQTSICNETTRCHAGTKASPVW